MTQGGHQRGEVIVRDLGLGCADGRDEGGLAHIGEADQAHISDQLQLQRHLDVLAGHTGLGKLGDLAGRRCKMCVAVAAAATLCDGDGGVVGQVRNDQPALRVLDHGAQRHLDDEVLGILAVAEACAALAALGGSVLALVAEVHQGGKMIVRHKDDVTAAAAIAAVRAASGHELDLVDNNPPSGSIDGNYATSVTVHWVSGISYVNASCTTMTQMTLDYLVPFGIIVG